MSHMASQYYNAWVAVMGGQPKHLLCTWHFDRAGLTELHAKVKDTVAAEIYKMLIVLQQTRLDSFENYLCKLDTQLSKLSMEFAEYFKKEWATRTELWAYCNGKNVGINANMAVEAFHIPQVWMPQQEDQQKSRYLFALSCTIF